MLAFFPYEIGNSKYKLFSYSLISYIVFVFVFLFSLECFSQNHLFLHLLLKQHSIEHINIGTRCNKMYKSNIFYTFLVNSTNTNNFK